MKLTKLALTCALTGALVACGGGSNSSTVESSGSIGEITRTLDGVAAKGLIKNGIVEVYSYDANGQKSAQPLVMTRTSVTDGSYSLNLGNNIGLFTIEVSADASTTMADEVSHKDIAMPIGMTLRSLVQLDSASVTAIKGHVTPFTDMLVTAAESAGGLTTANVAAAQSGVITMLGFNPLTTKPINADSDAAGTVMDQSEQLQSLALAAISKLANDGSLGCTQPTVSEKIKCAVAATTGLVTLQDGAFSIPLTAQAALDTALKTVVADPSINKTPLKTLDGKTTFSQASVSTSGTIENPVAAAKALFASLRTNIQAWTDAFNGGAAAQSASALKADFDAAIAPLDQDLADWILLSVRGTALFNDYMAGKSRNYVDVYQSVVASGSTPNSPYYFGAKYIGTCAVYANANVTPTTLLATTTSDAKSVFCALSRAQVPGSEKLDPTKAIKYTSQQFTKSIVLVPVTGLAGGQKFTYESRARMETAHYNKDQYGNKIDFFRDDIKLTIGNYGPTERANGTISFAMDGMVVTNATFDGDMPARTNSFGVAITDKETWNVNFTRTPETASVNKYALSGKITAYKDGASISAIELKNGSLIRALELENANQTFTLESIKEVNLALAVTSKDSKVVGTLSLDDFSADKKSINVIPTSLKFVGSFNNAGAEFFNGTLIAKTSNYASYDSNAADSNENFLKASVSFAGIAKIPNRPDLKLSLSANNPMFNTQAFTGQYDDGANVIMVKTTNATTTGAQFVDISSANGVTVQFVSGATTINVKKNNSVIASFDQSTGMISYTDGSFESLK